MSTQSVITPLSQKEQAFLESIKAQVGRLQMVINPRFASNIAFRFEVPRDFTPEEFSNVGRALTSLYWRWEEICKERHGWSFILLQL